MSERWKSSDTTQGHLNYCATISENPGWLVSQLDMMVGKPA